MNPKETVQSPRPKHTLVTQQLLLSNFLYNTWQAKSLDLRVCIFPVTSYFKIDSDKQV